MSLANFKKIFLTVLEWSIPFSRNILEIEVDNHGQHVLQDLGTNQSIVAKEKISKPKSEMAFMVIPIVFRTS